MSYPASGQPTHVSGTGKGHGNNLCEPAATVGQQAEGHQGDGQQDGARAKDVKPKSEKPHCLTVEQVAKASAEAKRQKAAKASKRIFTVKKSCLADTDELGMKKRALTKKRVS